jgi:sugar lactone lactonase YvrE
VHVIFWGAGWEQAGGPGPALREEVLNFYRALSGSGSPSGRAYQGILTQYFDATGRIAPTLAKTTSFIDTKSPPPVNVNGEAIGREAREAAKAKHWVLGPDSQFVVMPGPGATYEKGFGGFCAYHTVVGENGSYWTYTFVPYTGEPPFEAGCRSWDREFNAGHVQTMDAAHEYAESATDPAFSGWLDKQGEEIGDICAATDPLTENGKQTGVWVQGIWDDNQSACSLADEKPPHALGLTEGPSNLGLHEATLNATVNAENEGLATKYRFEYGPTTAYGKTVPAEGYVNVGSELGNQLVHQRLTGLPLGATVHYRVAATNSRNETMDGEDHTITPSEWSAGSVPLPAARNLQSSFGDALLSCSFTPWACGATSCPSSEECVAVGTYESSENIGGYFRELPMANTWKNGQWSVKALPIPEGTGKKVAMTGISCASTTACLAVGYEENTAGKRVPVAERLNGSEGWSASAISLPAGAVEAGFEGVSCASASECMGVGLSVNSTGGLVPYAALWNGSVWTVQNLPPEGGNASLESVSCPAAEYCVAVGLKAFGFAEEGVTETWNGKSWSVVSAQAPPGGGNFKLMGVSCASSTACMAVGNYNGAKGEAGLTERWNGEKWSFQAPAETGVQEELTGVSCPSAQECTAVGDYTPNGRWVPMAQTWNGASWSVQPLNTDAGGDPASEFHAVSCVAGSTCAAVGITGWSGSGRSHSAGPIRVLAEIRSTKTYVTSIEPLAGRPPGGAPVTIRGSGFVAPATVTIGGAPATSVEVLSESEIRAKTPSAPAGTYPVVVSDPNGTSPAGVTFTYSTMAATFGSSFGSAGFGSGQLRTPDGVAVDSSGNVWVSDTANNRVEEFSATGAFMMTFGWGVKDGKAEEETCTSTESCRAGIAGPGAGQLNEPAGIATEGGNVWVAEHRNNRVEEFSSGGAYLKKQIGGGPTGEFPIFPNGVALDGHGDLFVTGSSFGSLQKYSIATGEQVAPQVLTYINGYRGQYGVTVDQQGNVWVADQGSNRVREFSNSLAFKLGFGWGVKDGEAKLETCTSETECKEGISGSGEGQFNSPLGLALDGVGDVFVADSGNNRVEEFSATGNYITQFGLQFSRPAGIAVAGGQAYVVDSGNNRVQKWTVWENLPPAVVTAAASSLTPTTATLNATVNPNGSEVPACKFEYGTSSSYGNTAPCASLPGSGESPVGVSAALTGLSANTAYHFRIVATNSGGTSYGSDQSFTTAAAPSFSTSFGSEGTAELKFKGPAGVAVDSSGNIWVADSANNRVEELSPAGAFIKTFGWGVSNGNKEFQTCMSGCLAGIAGSENGQFNGPWGIAIAPKGEVWVTDKGNSRLEEFSSEGKYITKFGKSGANPGEFEVPLGIAIGPDGNIWLAENSRNYVEEFKPNGEFITRFTSIYGPAGIAVATNGNVWVTDSLSNRVQEFSSAGAEITQVGSEGSGNGQLKSPQGVSLDSKGYLWVDDSGNNRVEEFSPTGEFVITFGSGGSGPAQFSGPQGIVVAGGLAYVTDGGNNRVEKWTVAE